ncbi:MAG: NUDIX domain-containing protein [Candidatus Aminicenantes bacterium]|nr:NUDIX domain-containing protein [Candidatus Aminicenantes bacterium]NIM81113.1 NUDIX domain-containing protein [Candidatus Aminicenantes bacterium]NIN20487.1 NUDIX domain-containing protein [Candidatus Aminicenantes bacterium]NIN44260.1 NUDIX domain-containing protein [Candidatus Aminicenantes bacterium]NIN87079.1 NUDIX domain-containing protein [Candidatus Aminicenantes bacterium]
MPKLSAGLLMYRFRDEKLEVFLVHPGGPYWAKKDMGSWSIPKGEYSQEEDPFIAAKREFHEETGFELDGQFIPLTTLKQSSGKKITAWAIEGDCDASKIKSNTFTLEWPPRSGKQMEFPEIDRAEWFGINLAKKKILKGQVGFIEELCNILTYEPSVKDEVNNKTEESKAKNKKPVQRSTF